MLSVLKNEANKTYTENGAMAYRSTGSNCLNWFAACGALRQASYDVQQRLFIRAYVENPNIAMKILFYARDVREGLGERDLFRTILLWLANNHPESVRKNIPLFSEYGRWDDLLILLNTACERRALDYIQRQLLLDVSAMRAGQPVSLLGKWLPSLHTSSIERRYQARKICRFMHMTEKDYRKTLAALRTKIDIVEKKLCASDYTFAYSKVPSGAMLKYQKAFLRNDAERYRSYISQVQTGVSSLHADTLYPYQIIHKCIHIVDQIMDDMELYKGTDYADLVQALDASWKSLPDYCDGRNALAVIDGSGSMYTAGGSIQPAEVAMSLGIYFAERNSGFFKNHFITFSENPQLVELRGENIADKTAFCMSYNEIANTNLFRVFSLLLKTARDHNLPQSDLPEMLYIISDMEFDEGVEFDRTLFEAARAMYQTNGYRLPTIVYWNVNHRNEQFPVRSNDVGAILASGASPNIFRMVISGSISPEEYMMSIVNSERYLPIKA